MYAGIDPLSGKRNYLVESVPAGKDAQREAGRVRRRLVTQVDEQRNPRTKEPAPWATAAFGSAPGPVAAFQAIVLRGCRCSDPSRSWVRVGAATIDSSRPADAAASAASAAVRVSRVWPASSRVQRGLIWRPLVVAGVGAAVRRAEAGVEVGSYLVQEVSRGERPQVP
ncbi:hypothetical protein GCM10023175_02310 [Pseudonocardia xishanensis]|uniref:Uncharacterized protein n=1 Tax=Pseudonocardia xishanensis TaxID=630995 RepID=A0ABP8RD63_9PSEU